MVQISGAQAFGRSALIVAAAVELVGDVKRLMQIADEMQQELQGEEPLVCSGIQGGEFGSELIDLIDQTGLRRTAGC